LADGEAKGKDEILIRIDQRMVNQKNPSQMVAEAMSPEITEENNDVSDVDKRDTSKGIAWQRMSTCTKRRKQKKI